MKKVKSIPIPTKYVSRLLIDNANGTNELADIGIAWNNFPIEDTQEQEQEQEQEEPTEEE